MSWLELIKAAAEVVANTKLTDPSQFNPKGFRAIDGGVIYSVDKSCELARANVKWIYDTWSYNNPTSGATRAQRGQVEVRDAFDLLRPSGLADEQRGIFYDRSDKKFFLHGILFKSEHERPFLIVQVDGKYRIVTFQHFSEFQHWCEKHLSVDQYIEVFQGSSDGESGPTRFVC